jgi:hypothetical protein
MYVFWLSFGSLLNKTAELHFHYCVFGKVNRQIVFNRMGATTAVKCKGDNEVFSSGVVDVNGVWIEMPTYFIKNIL